MATKKSKKKSTSGKKPTGKKPAGIKPRKRPSVRRSSQQEPAECGEFNAYTQGSKKLVIEIANEASFDASLVIEGEACRSLIRCRIVNGQWECDA